MNFRGPTGISLASERFSSQASIFRAIVFVVRDRVLRKLIGVLVLACGLLLAFEARSAENEMTAAQELVRLLRYDEQYEAYRHACKEAISFVEPKVLLAKDPDRFGGIAPGSDLWPSVLAAYDDYFRELCARPTKEEFLFTLARSYARNLTPSELRAALEFYSGPLGRRLVETHKSAASSVYDEWGRLNAENSAKATSDLEARIQELVKQFK